MTDGNDVKLKAIVENEANRHIGSCRDRCDEKRVDIYGRIKAVEDRLGETREEFAKMSGRNAVIMTIVLSVVMLVVQFVFKAWAGG